MPVLSCAICAAPIDDKQHNSHTMHLLCSPVLPLFCCVSMCKFINSINVQEFLKVVNRWCALAWPSADVVACLGNGSVPMRRRKMVLTKLPRPNPCRRARPPQLVPVHPTCVCQKSDGHGGDAHPMPIWQSEFNYPKSIEQV